MSTEEGTPPTVSLQAAIELDFHTPEGTRMYLATLLPDPDCNCQRHRLGIVATADTEEAARQVLSLAALRLRAALEPVEDSAARVVGS